MHTTWYIEWFGKFWAVDNYPWFLSPPDPTPWTSYTPGMGTEV